jgi:hypothetical protein
MMKSLSAFALALPLACSASPAIAELVSGTGQAPITKDVETVRTQARNAAKRDIVKRMLVATIGQSRLNEVSPDAIAGIAGQLRDDMLTGQSSQRDGQTFSVTLNADIDGGWFRTQLDNYDIQSSSRRADNNRQLIFVMLDAENGVGSDYSKPSETHYAYDRATGGSYSDHSTVDANSRDASASSSHSASAHSASGSAAYRASAAGAFRGDSSAAYGENGPYGSAAGRARNSAAGSYSGSAAGAAAYRSDDASASSASNARLRTSNYAERNRVDAEVHDNVHVREDVIYQRPPANSDGDAIMRAFQGKLIDYGVQTADPWSALSSYFANRPPRYDSLKRDARFVPFLRSLKAQDATFFMGGTLRVTHSAVDVATGQARCSASLDASVSATDNGRTIAAGQFDAGASGMSPEECGHKAAATVAQLASAKMGPQIQNYWRAIARDSVGQDTSQLANYTLVLRSTRLDMAMQADLLDALQSTPGVSGQNFVSQAGNEMRFTVSYAGGMPLQLALFQKLRNNPAFAGMQSKVDGRSVLLCLSGCTVTQ